MKKCFLMYEYQSAPSNIVGCVSGNQRGRIRSSRRKMLSGTSKIVLTANLILGGNFCRAAEKHYLVCLGHQLRACFDKLFGLDFGRSCITPCPRNWSRHFGKPIRNLLEIWAAFKVGAPQQPLHLPASVTSGFQFSTSIFCSHLLLLYVALH